MRTWFDEVAELVNVLFLLTHITCGGPARGTEIEATLIQNTSFATRNLYAVGGHGVIVSKYNKTRQNHVFDKLVARCYPPQVFRIVLYYVAVIRPLERYWITELYTRNKGSHYEAHMWVRHDRLMDSKAFTQELRDFTLSALGVPLGLSQWRHVVKSVFRNLLNIKLHEDDSDDHNPLLDTFGHEEGSVGVSHYALDDKDLPFIGTSLFNDILAACRSYHHFFSFSISSSYQKHLKDQVSLEQKMSAALDRLNGVMDNVVTPEAVGDVVGARMRTMFRSDILPTIHHTLNTTFLPLVQRATHRDLALANRSTSAYAESSDIPEIPSFNLPVHPSRLAALRRLFADEKISFRSQEQALAFEAICRRDKHVVAVMRTGGGKSALFMAPPLSEDGVTVVIFPYISLVDDMCRRAEAHSLCFAKFPLASHESLHGLQLLFVSAHLVTDDTFVTLLENLFKLGKLVRVVIDEAHHINVSSDFRLAYRALNRLTALGVQLVFLSATLSHQSVHVLLQTMHIPPQSVHMIRGPTHRGEIRYEVQRIDPMDFSDTLVATIERAMLTWDPCDRGIIYCSHIDDCLNLSKITGYPVYHGELSASEKQKVSASWRSGEKSWVIATKAYGEGVDFPHVRLVIHTPRPTRHPSLLEYIQQSQRAGRDGQFSTALYLFRGNGPLQDVPSPDYAGFSDMRQYLQDEQQCRRLLFGLYADGVTQSCTSIPDSNLCDHCSATLVSCRFIMRLLYFLRFFSDC